MKHPKMDPKLISSEQWEIDYIIKRFAKKGITITEEELKSLMGLYNNSRRLVYKALTV